MARLTSRFTNANVPIQEGRILFDEFAGNIAIDHEGVRRVVANSYSSGYGVSTSPQGNVVKEVNIPNFKLANGVIVSVLIGNTNSNINNFIQLNVSNTGAFNIIDQVTRSGLVGQRARLLTSTNIEQFLFADNSWHWISQPFDWCSGSFNDRSLASGASEIITPSTTTSFSGMATLINGNAFRASSTGTWGLFCGGGNFGTAPSVRAFSLIWRNDTSLQMNRVAFNSNNTGGTATNSNIPFIECTVRLSNGDDLIHLLRSENTAQTTILRDGAVHRFWFGRIA